MRLGSNGVLLLVLVSIFCAVGYLHTYEPNPPDVQLRWRIIYGGVAALCLVGIIGNSFGRSKPPE